MTSTDKSDRKAKPGVHTLPTSPSSGQVSASGDVKPKDLDLSLEQARQLLLRHRRRKPYGRIPSQDDLAKADPNLPLE